MENEEARKIFKPGMKIRPCQHLHDDWSADRPNRLEMHVAKSPDDDTKLFAVCEKCLDFMLSLGVCMEFAIDFSRMERWAQNNT